MRLIVATSTPAYPSSTDDPFDHWSRQFNRAFSSPQVCVEELYRKCLSRGHIRCPDCSGVSLSKRYGERKTICTACGKRFSFTAGTFFDRIRNPRAWLAAIYLLERGVPVTALKLCRLVGVAPSSALNILRKLRMSIERELPDNDTIPSICFAGCIYKRSRETPSRAHPRAEIGESTEMHWAQTQVEKCGPPDDNRHGPSPGGPRERSQPNIQSRSQQEDEQLGQLSASAQSVLALLGSKPACSDLLIQKTQLDEGDLSYALITLELEGLAQRLPGDQYIRTERQIARERPTTLADFAGVSSKAKSIENFIRKHFRGVSRKYLQCYAATHWCCVDRARWKIDTLLEACLRMGRLTYRQLLAYVSPDAIRTFQSRAA